MRKSMTKAALAAMVAMSGMALSVGSGVEAGDPEPEAEGELVVVTQVIGPDALEAVEGIEFELYPLIAPDTYGSEMKAAIVGDSCVRRDASLAGSLALSFELCDLLAGSYRLGLTGVPDGLTAEVICGDGLPFFGGGREILTPSPTVDPDFTVGGGTPSVSCFVLLFDDAPLTVDFLSEGVGHLDAQSSIAVEAYQYTDAAPDPIIGPNVIGDGTCTGRTAVNGGSSSVFVGTPQLGSTTTSFDCDVAEGDYQLGVDGVADGYSIDGAFCFPRNYPVLLGLDERIDDDDARFAIALEPDARGSYGAYCTVFLDSPPTLYLDATVTGGTAELSEFELEVFAGTAGDLLSTVTDPSSEPCEPMVGEIDEFPIPNLTFDPTLCAATALPDGEYQIGATLPAYGYVVDSVVCERLDYDSGLFEERIESVPAFSHPVSGPDEGSGAEAASRCTVEFSFVEQTVDASVTVENGFGGTAAPADFTIEVFELDGDTPGDLVASGPSPASFTLPVGEYVFGVDGPAGYEYTVDVMIEDVSTEALDRAVGGFTLVRARTVTAALAATQTAPTTTTTTTTTSVPVAAAASTTAAPTSAAPTTAAPTVAAPTTPTPTTGAPTTGAPTTTARPTAALPATGSGSAPMVWWSIGLLLLGVGVMMTARRRSNMRW